MLQIYLLSHPIYILMVPVNNSNYYLYFWVNEPYSTKFLLFVRLSLFVPTKCLHIVISDGIITRSATKKLKKR